MSIDERRKREKKHRRETIIQAAKELIQEKGLDAVTMNDIAKRSELSKGTLYLYFPSRDELVYSINSQGFNLINEKLSEILLSGDTGDKMLRTLFKFGVNFSHDHPLFFEAFRYYELYSDSNDLEEKPIVKECEEKRQILFTLSERIFQIAIQDGSIKSKYSPKLLTIIHWSGIRGLLEFFDTKSTIRHTPFFQNFLQQDHDIHSTYLEIIMHGIIQKQNVGE